jgi:RNase P/RNase MRP subunit p30
MIGGLIIKMINNTDLVKVRNEIKRLVSRDERVVVRAHGDDFNRKIFEMRDVDMVIGLEFFKRDRLKQRDSGLNEVLVKLAKKNGIVIGVDVGRLVKLDKLEKAKVLSRVRQNIKLCKRVGVGVVGWPFDIIEKRDFEAFLKVVG